MPNATSPRKPGRPSRYSRALGDRICADLAGGKSLRSICRRAAMPGISTVMGWLSDGKHEEFSAQYARAREAAAEGFASEVVAIADAADTRDAQTIAKARLRIDARKWAAGKMAPKRWGTERVEHAGDPDAPLFVQIERVNQAPGQMGHPHQSRPNVEEDNVEEDNVEEDDAR